jgi:hypothetical protein
VIPKNKRKEMGRGTTKLGVAMTEGLSTAFHVPCPVCREPMKHAKWKPVLFKGQPADAILVCEACRVEATCRPSRPAAASVPQRKIA